GQKTLAKSDRQKAEKLVKTNHSCLRDVRATLSQSFTIAGGTSMAISRLSPKFLEAKIASQPYFPPTSRLTAQLN
ncbi:MAG: hypothetical protein ACK53L_10885, partial [Pirellulaceae bacterium]